MSKRSNEPQPTETPQAEAITVAWLVSVMIVTLLDIAAAAAHIHVMVVGAAAQRTTFASYTLHTAVITGTISLLLAALAFKLRTQKPPPRVTMFSVIVAAVPIIAAVLALLSR